MKASLWGAKYLRCLGASDLRPSLGRHASSGSARLLEAMQISGCLYTPYIQDQHYSASSSTDLGHRNFIYDIIDDFFIRHTFQDLVGYLQILDIVV
jgi:hypothetical protein